MDAAADSKLTYTDPGWETKYKKGSVQRSVGFLMENSPQWVVLARDWCAEENGYRSWIDVPQGWVLEMKVLGSRKKGGK